MAAALSDLEAAIALYYDDSSPADEKEEGEEKEEEAEAALPSGDVVSHILNNAKEGEDAERWAGPGRTLSGDSSASPPTDSRQNAKRVRIIFWADGFTVEDLSREEAEEEAPAAPRARKTGIQTLGDHRAAESRMPQMKVPELRKYEDNHQFMEDLKKGLPPSEFREIDLSSGIPRHRPVDIMLGDLRPAAYPSHLGRMPQGRPSAQQIEAPKLTPFSGAGRSMRDLPGEGSGTQPAPPPSEMETLSVDESLPQTTLQLRLHDGSRRIVKANHSHTVKQLQAHVASLTPGVAFELRAGFPPKPLSENMEATLKEANLLAESIVQAGF